jgi:phosphonatase-like hydrolase
VRIALNTGFDRDTTARLLDHLEALAGAADAIVCGDDVPKGRPAPDLILRAMALTGIANPGLVANVGDTTLDLEAGRRAGVRWNVGVLSGAHGRDALAAAPHTSLIDSVALLPGVFGEAQ